MKKKLGIILAILLCAMLIFTFVACNNKTDEGGTTNNGGSGSGGSSSGSGGDGGSLSGVSDEDIQAMYADIQKFLDDWAKTNAMETYRDLSKELNNDLNASSTKNKFTLASKSDSYSVTFKVAYAEPTYTVTATWGKKQNLKKTFTVTANKVNYKAWAGQNSKTSNYEFLEDSSAVLDTLDTMVVAFVNTMNEVTSNSVTGKFGVDGTLGFEAFGLNYGLKVQSNVDMGSAKDTDLGITVVNREGEAIVGFYYKGAASAKDSKFYFAYPVTVNGNKEMKYRYWEYADLVGWLNNLLTDDETKKSIIKTEPGKGIFEFYEKPEEGEEEDEDLEPERITIEGLTDLLSAYGVGIGGIITGVVKLLAKPYAQTIDDNTTRLLLDINLADVMKNLSQILSGFMSEEDSPEFLQNLGINLNTMDGLQGHIAISATVKTETVYDEEEEEDVEYKTLSDFEFAVNIPEETKFYRSADDESPISIPSIGFAIYLNDFDFITEGKVENVIPQEAFTGTANGAGYFSPTNLDLEGDVYVKADTTDSVFHFDFVTDINPLEILEKQTSSTARVALRVLQNKDKGDVPFVNTEEKPASNFLTITYEQASKELCVSGTAFGLDDGTTLYYYNMNNKTKDQIVADVKNWLGIANWVGIDFDLDKGIVVDPETVTRESAKVIFGDALVKELMEYFMTKFKEVHPELVEEEEPEEQGSAAFDMGAITGYVDTVKALYNSLVDAKVIEMGSDPTFFRLDVTKATVDTILKAINDTFGTYLNAPLPQLDEKGNPVLDDDGNPLPRLDEKGNLIIGQEVKLEIVKVEANSKGYEGKVYIKVKYGNYTYELLIDNSKEGEFSMEFTYGKKDRSYTFGFEAVSQTETTDSTKWAATFTYQKKDGDGEPVGDPMVISLRNYHGEWGNNNKEEIEELLPTAAAKEGETQAIFPADGTGPVTELAKGILAILNKDNIKPTVKLIGEFIIRQIDLSNIQIGGGEEPEAA